MSLFWNRVKADVLSDPKKMLDLSVKENKDIFDKIFADDNTKVYLVLYKDTYWFWSRVIRWWTKSIYSHSEFYIENGDKKYLVGISNDCAVRIKEYDGFADGNKTKWDFFEFENNKEIRNALKDQFLNTQGCKYDWLGIVMSDIFARKDHRPNKYTCSEWAIEVLDRALKVVYPKWYNMFTPGDLYTYILNNEELKSTLNVKEVIMDGQSEEKEQ